MLAAPQTGARVPGNRVPGATGAALTCRSMTYKFPRHLGVMASALTWRWLAIVRRMLALPTPGPKSAFGLQTATKRGRGEWSKRRLHRGSRERVGTPDPHGRLALLRRVRTLVTARGR